jgi:hypothetical protein
VSDKVGALDIMSANVPEPLVPVVEAKAVEYEECLACQ